MGDEGKAKITDLLSEEVEYIVHYQGGANDGHTVSCQADLFKFHLIPSGYLFSDKVCIIGTGTIIEPSFFTKRNRKVKKTKYKFRSWFSSTKRELIRTYRIKMHSLKEEEELRGREAMEFDGLKASFRIRGNVDGEMVEKYFEKYLVKELKPGQIVVWENASYHKRKGIQRVVEEVECKFLFLPAYSPDFNPVEPSLSQLKPLVKKSMRQVQKTISTSF